MSTAKFKLEKSNVFVQRRGPEYDRYFTFHDLGYRNMISISEADLKRLCTMSTVEELDNYLTDLDPTR